MRHPLRRSNHLMTASTLLIVLTGGPAASAGSVTPPFSAEVVEDAAEASRKAMEQEKVDRLAAADLVTLVAPTWSVRPGRTSELYVLNNFAEDIDLEVEALDPAGRSLATTVVTVAPARHEVVAVGSLVGTAPGVVRDGSLRVRYSGDEDMIQAWMVLSGPGGVTEMVLKNVTVDTERALTAFWDLRGLRSGPTGRMEAEYVLVNGGETPLTYSIRGGGPGPDRTGRVLATELLLPGQRTTWAPVFSATAAAFGWVEIVHDASPGSLAVGGLLRGEGLFATLPVIAPEARSARPEYHAVRLPFAAEVAAGTGDALLTLANTAQEGQRVTVTLLAAASGRPVAEESIDLAGGGVSTVDLGSLVQGGVQPGEEGLRIVVRGEASGLLVDGRSRSFLTGETVELAFFPRDDAHSNGSYPLPDPERFAVKTTLVNLGDEDSRVVGQVSWDDGTFAMKPLTVPAGATRTIDFTAVAGAGEEDRLGRSVPSLYQAGFFRWTVQGGGRDLIARTEAVPLDGGDAFGFNCFGCCFEWSRGEVIPTSTTFPYYSTDSFEGVEYIDTCSGTMGPYWLYDPTYYYNWPLSWNGATVSASAPDAQDISFQATGHKIQISTCSEIPITIYGAGPATATKVTVLEASLPANRVKVRLEPANKSGTLKVYLQGSTTKTLVNTTYSSGDHIIGFGNLSNYTAGTSYSKVVAEWTVDEKLARGSRNYSFEVLGNYNHTQYNVPSSNQGCSGSILDFCYFTGDCKPVDCTSFSTASAPSEWIFEVNENGSGSHLTIGFVTQEEYCAHPASCTNTFRRVSQPCPACKDKKVIPGATVAVNSSHTKLDCGSRVFVDSVGELEVTDYGGQLTVSQLDHYVGVSGCNFAATIGNRMTFLLK